MGCRVKMAQGGSQKLREGVRWSGVGLWGCVVGCVGLSGVGRSLGLGLVSVWVWASGEVR